MASKLLIVRPEDTAKSLLYRLAMNIGQNMLFGVNAEWLKTVFPQSEPYELKTELQTGGNPANGSQAVTVGEGLLWCLENGIPEEPLFFPGSQYEAEGHEDEHYNMPGCEVDFSRLIPVLMIAGRQYALCAANWMTKEQHKTESHQLIAVSREPV